MCEGRPNTEMRTTLADADAASYAIIVFVTVTLVIGEYIELLAIIAPGLSLLKAAYSTPCRSLAKTTSETTLTAT